MENKEQLIEAIELWDNFKKKVLYKNRFFINDKVLDFIKDFSDKNQIIIESDTVLYRARLYSENDTYLLYNENTFSNELNPIEKLYIRHNDSRRKAGFWGYSAEKSFVPTNNELINDGRANPCFIKYLYTSEQPYTALVEIRPYLNSKVSIAEIKVGKPLKLADFSYTSYGKFDGFERYLIFLIISEFSKPSDSDRKDYIATQCVTEFIKTMGFDGIRFNSSLHEEGRNITIFNYDDCTPTGSKLYEISDICFEAKGIAPRDASELVHSKLALYKERKLNVQAINKLLQSRKAEKDK
jgi:hypothetical protein